MNYTICKKDTEVLRMLATRLAEIATWPCQKAKADLWKRHNDLKTNEPVVFCDPETGWREIIRPEDLLCTGELARKWEMKLRKDIFWAESIRDDKVIDDLWPVNTVYIDTGWGLIPRYKGKEVGKAYHIESVLDDYEKDFDKLRFPRIIYDEQATKIVWEEANRVFYGILKPYSFDKYWWSLGLTSTFIELRGFENFLCDFVDEPEWLMKTIAFLYEGTIKKMDFLESNGKLRSNAGNIYVGSGGFGFTDELPKPLYEGEPSLLKNMWGFVESQETVSVSPSMYGEFIFPYHFRLASRFGLNCYGCCEPFENRWEYIKKLPNLRRISVSPWSNRNIAMELLGCSYIASHKLNPNVLSLSVIDEKTARAQIRHALDVSKNGFPELIMKDTTTIGNNPNNVVKWVKIAREEIGNL